jgi:hypothetical protein
VPTRQSLSAPVGADQAAVTLGNVDGEIGGLMISDPPTQAELQALRDRCEELADDVRALSTLVQALRGALVAVGVVRRGVGKDGGDAVTAPPDTSLLHAHQDPSPRSFRQALPPTLQVACQGDGDQAVPGAS